MDHSENPSAHDIGPNQDTNRLLGTSRSKGNESICKARMSRRVRDQMKNRKWRQSAGCEDACG